eukprot:3089525-Rhodomonas_salina.1
MNTAVTTGGAADVDGSTFYMVAGTFDQNKATTDGGAVHATGAASTVGVNMSTLTSNQAVNDGGAIALVMGTLSLGSDTFLGNTANNTGGA